MGKLYAVGFGPGGYEHMTAKAIDVIKNADVILVMKDGNIIEQGTHDELLQAGGFYKHLYESQFAK